LLRIRKFVPALRKDDGAEIAEAALVLPLVFTLLLGIVWFGRAFNIYSTIQQAAQQGAITAARSSCATCGNAPATDATVSTAVEAVMNASNVAPAQILIWNPGLIACPSPPAPPGGGCTPPTSGKITVCRNVLLNHPNSAQPPQCGTAVSFKYPFSFNFPGTSLNMQSITMFAQAQSRMEN
jgi:hypothetical protein